MAYSTHRLRNLEAAKNELRELPPSLSSLSQLQVVDVSHNQISSAAPLAPLVGLVAVQLGDNALESLPEWRYGCGEMWGGVGRCGGDVGRCGP